VYAIARQVLDRIVDKQGKKNTREKKEKKKETIDDDG
jgi:hypothetical protein